MTPCRGLSRLAQYQVKLNEKSEKERRVLPPPPAPKNPDQNTTAMFDNDFMNIMLCITNVMQSWCACNTLSYTLKPWYVKEKKKNKKSREPKLLNWAPNETEVMQY